MIRSLYLMLKRWQLRREWHRMWTKPFDHPELL